MTHILKNRNLEIYIDLPLEHYTYSRFDWTGKIVKVKFQNICVSGTERNDLKDEQHFGKGFYNEFGIDAPVGFNEAYIGGWFHKIGVGLLKKDDNEYIFHKDYKIRSAEFEFSASPDKVIFSCKSQALNGYSYDFKKEIELFENGFIINYLLKNTGAKTINTNEYNHNFIAINNDLTGSNYIVNFPFQMKPELFGETVNPEQKVDIGQNRITFNGPPTEQFFLSNLSGGENVAAGWEVINMKSKIGISETGSFQTNKVNLWGWKHVISPELFFDISIKPGQSVAWSRTYNLYNII